MKKTNTYTHDELFKQECKVINLKYEYPGYMGTEQWAIITILSEEELNSKYAEQVAPLRPFILPTASFGNIRDDFWRNEKKHHMRAVRNLDAFHYDDEVITAHHPELIQDTLEDELCKDIEICKLREAIAMLKPLQRERLVKFFFEGKSTRKIAQEERVAYSAVDKSIACAIRNLKKFMD